MAKKTEPKSSQPSYKAVKAYNRLLKRMLKGEFDSLGSKFISDLVDMSIYISSVAEGFDGTTGKRSQLIVDAVEYSTLSGPDFEKPKRPGKIINRVKRPEGFILGKRAIGKFFDQKSEDVFDCIVYQSFPDRDGGNVYPNPPFLARCMDVTEHVDRTTRDAEEGMRYIVIESRRLSSSTVLQWKECVGDKEVELTYFIVLPVEINEIGYAGQAYLCLPTDEEENKHAQNIEAAAIALKALADARSEDMNYAPPPKARAFIENIQSYHGLSRIEIDGIIRDNGLFPDLRTENSVW